MIRGALLWPGRIPETFQRTVGLRIKIRSLDSVSQPTLAFHVGIRERGTINALVVTVTADVSEFQNVGLDPIQVDAKFHEVFPGGISRRRARTRLRRIGREACAAASCD